jgi:hypothetical protein
MISDGRSHYRFGWHLRIGVLGVLHGTAPNN